MIDYIFCLNEFSSICFAFYIRHSGGLNTTYAPVASIFFAPVRTSAQCVFCLLHWFNLVSLTVEEIENGLKTL